MVALVVMWDLVDGLSHVLELCGVGADRSVIVWTDVDADPDQLRLLRLAIGRSGAAAVEVGEIGTHRDGRAGSRDRAIIAELTQAVDLVIDCTSTRRSAGLDLDVGVLHLGPLLNAVADWPAHANLVLRTTALREAIEAASVLTIVDDWGTNLEIALGRAEVTSRSGLVTATERETSFPAGSVDIVPSADTVWGSLVLMPGDGNVTRGRHIDSPVTLQVAGDRVNAIQGETADADVVRALLERAGRDEAYDLEWLAIGLNPGRVGTAAPFSDELCDAARCSITAGAVAVGVGSDPFGDLTAASRLLTVALAGRTVVLDDAAVVAAGQLTGEFAPDAYELAD